MIRLSQRHACTMGDGAVRFMSDSINLATMYNLADISDQNILGEF